MELIQFLEPMPNRPTWDYIETQAVGTNRKITMPSGLRADFVVRNLTDDPSVLWYWLMSAGVALLVSDDLTDGEYQRFGYRKYYQSNQFQFPDDLNPHLSYELTEDDTAVFLAHERMLSGEPKSMYVMTDQRALEFLDVDVTETDDIVELLKQQPAFFDSV